MAQAISCLDVCDRCFPVLSHSTLAGLQSDPPPSSQREPPQTQSDCVTLLLELFRDILVPVGFSPNSSGCRARLCSTWDVKKWVPLGLEAAMKSPQHWNLPQAKQRTGFYKTELWVTLGRQQWKPNPHRGGRAGSRSHDKSRDVKTEVQSGSHSARMCGAGSQVARAKGGFVFIACAIILFSV